VENPALSSAELAFALRSRVPTVVSPIVSSVVDRFSIGRPFSSKYRRGLVVFFDHMISQSQVYPFTFYSKRIQARFGMELRFTPFSKAVAGGSSNLRDAEVIFLQTWWSIQPEELERTFEQLRKSHPNARIYYLDAFAPADLRLARTLKPHIHGYIKKHLLKTHALYSETTFGDTNLEEYYARLFSIERPRVDWQVPTNFADNVLIGPGFFTAAHFIRAFLKPFAAKPDRPIDLHARFAVDGTPWYAAMRTLAKQAVDAIGNDLVVRSGADATSKQYMDELGSSKACFSPFGYGEVCWRDIEAMLTGTVLIKPDMGHLQVDPQLFIPHETYVPVRWDFADLAEKVHQVAKDADYRRHLTENAYRQIQDYLQNERFLDQMRPCFE
jgi:hypothetical protein